jgi:hypothetical protein
MYRIIGADGREYGPVGSEVLRRWIAEGRVTAQTSARAEGTPGWKPISAFPEFADVISPPPVSGPPPFPVADGYPPKDSAMAVAGFVCSLLGLMWCCGPVFSILGLVFSIVGLNEIKRNPRQLTGRSFAVAGIVVAILGLALFILFLAGGFWGGMFRHVRPHRLWRL